MLVKEKSTTNALVEYGKLGAYNGTGNYIRSKNKYSIVIAQLEQLAFPVIPQQFNLINEPTNRTNYLDKKFKKSDLPLVSDFGGDIDPKGLVYARLEGLQYYSKTN